MTIVANVDNRPTYFDQIGNILAYGKLKFFAKGTTTPKAPFWDEDLTVPASTEQLLLANGTTTAQLFLGHGDYYVQCLKFFGTDPTMADPNDWQFDHQYDIGGLPLQSVASITASLNVTTIPNLRLIDGTTSTFKNFQVMGYWTEGDIFPRTYVWSPNELGADNQGTIIRNPLISTGAFVLSIEGPVTDCRIFGIIPGRASSNNAAIASLVTTVQATPTLPQTIYFPRGIYEVVGGTYQYFDTNVYIDQGAQFKNTSFATSYYMVFRSTFTNQSTSNIQATTSTGSVLLKFENRAGSEEVDPRWFGCILDGMTDDGKKFQLCVLNTYQNYPIKLVGIVRMATLTSSFTINNPIHCYNMGGFSMAQSTYFVTFNAPGYISNKYNKRWNGQYYPVFYGYANAIQYKFTNYPEIRTSWFASPTENNLSTLFIDLYLGKWNANVSNATPVIFDYPVNAFSAAGWALEDSYNYDFHYEMGTLISQGTAKIYLPNFKADANAPDIFVNDPFVVCSGVTYAIWWKNITGAIQSVFAAGGILDLGGNTYTLGASIPITIFGSDEVTIRNGEIDSTASINYFNISDTGPGLFLENIYFYDGANSSTVVSVSNCTLNRFVANNCVFISTGGTFLRYPTSGKVLLIDIYNSTLRCGYLCNDDTYMEGRLSFYNNLLVECDATMRMNDISITNNRISGATGGAKIWKIASVTASRIKGNIFTEVDLAPMSHVASWQGTVQTVGNEPIVTTYTESRITHIITGNEFHSTSSKYSRVMFTANTIGMVGVGETYFRGCIVSDNIFTESFNRVINFDPSRPIPTQPPIYVFAFVLVGSATWGTSGHNLNVCSNGGENDLLILQSTRGSCQLEFVKTQIPNKDQWDLYEIPAPIPESVLVIPGASFDPITTGNMHTNYNNFAIQHLLTPYINYYGCNQWTSTGAFGIVFQNNRNVTSVGDNTWTFGIQLQYNLYGVK